MALSSLLPVSSELSTMTYIALAFVFFWVLGLWYLVELLKPPGKRRTRNGQMPKLPPGPNGLPVFGNLLDMQERMGADGVSL